ncbi:hypothetical protein ACFL96_11310 [Thermoproteota archaeon]
MTHTQHRLIHPRSEEGIVHCDSILKTVTENEKKSWERVKKIRKPSFPRAYDFFSGIYIENSEIRLSLIYSYANRLFYHIPRKQINPETGKPYSFSEHTSCTASILSNAGYTSETVSAGLLHDLEKIKDIDLADMLSPLSPRAQGIVKAVSNIDQENADQDQNIKNEMAKRRKKEEFMVDYLLIEVS